MSEIITTPPPQQDATIAWIARRSITPSKLNPRTHFAEEKIAELERSFRSRGFDPALSHLLVRPLQFQWAPMEISNGMSLLFRTHDSVKWESVRSLVKEWPELKDASWSYLLTEDDCKKAVEWLPNYELVCGGRRWRAAGKAELQTVPCVVRELSDGEVIELQLVENLQREDLDPMEEAQGLQQYDALLAERDPKASKADRYLIIAQKIGLESLSAVQDRLSLCKLAGSAAGKAIAAGALSISHGRLLARLPDTVIDEVAQKCMANPYGPSPMPRQQLEALIRDEYQKELRGASFELTDAALVPVVRDDQGDRLMGGACSDCPFNSKGEGRFRMCHQPGCFKAKENAAYERWRVSVTDSAKNQVALSADENAALWDDGGTSLQHNSPYVELSDRPGKDEVKEGADPQPWKKLIAGQGVPVIVARDGSGALHTLALRSLVVTAAKQNDKEKPARDRLFMADSQDAAESINDEEAGKQTLDEKRALERASKIDAAQFAAVVEKARSLKMPAGFVSCALPALIASVDEHGDADEVVQRNGWDSDRAKADTYGNLLRAKAKKLEDPFQAGLMVELLLMQYLGHAAMLAALPMWAKMLGVDLKAVRKTVEQALDAEEKKVAADAEIAEGLKWETIKEQVEDFKINGSNVIENPDVCALTFPKSAKVTATVSVGRVGLKAWVAGWMISCTKIGRVEPCSATGAKYGSRALALRTGLTAVRQLLLAKSAPVEAQERVQAYIALAGAPQKKAEPQQKKGK